MQFMFHMKCIIEGEGALVYPYEKHQYQNKGDRPFKMISGVPKEFEWSAKDEMKDFEIFVSTELNRTEDYRQRNPLR